VGYRLARQALSVTLIDKGPSSAAGVTAGSFTWIGGSGRDSGKGLRPAVGMGRTQTAAARRMERRMAEGLRLRRAVSSALMTLKSLLLRFDELSVGECP
jgi:glycine/D-amino acid oxidase-like deaminating enzyme